MFPRNRNTRLTPDFPWMLDFIKDIELSGSAQTLVVEDRLQPGQVDGLIITYVGPHIQELFFGTPGGASGIMEPAHGPYLITAREFRGDATAIDLILGVEEIGFTGLLELLGRQGSGQQGDLSVTGMANFSRATARNGQPQLIASSWQTDFPYGPGWHIEAMLRDQGIPPGARIFG